MICFERVKPASLCIVFIILFLTQAHAAPVKIMTGESRLVASGKLIYLEEHWLDMSKQTLDIRYADETGQLLATKHLDYRHQRVCPAMSVSFTHMPLVYGTKVNRTTVDGTSIELFSNLNNQQVSPAGKTIDFSNGSKSIVVDAGLAVFIQDNYAMLKKGEELNCEFVLALRLTTIAFRVKKVMPAETDINWEELEYPFDPDMVVVAEPSNWLVQKVAPEAYFVYNAHRRLTYYQGPAGIANKDGEVVKIITHYIYVAPLPEQFLSGNLADGFGK